MRRTAVESFLAVSLVAGLGVGLSARTTQAREGTVVPLGSLQERAASQRVAQTSMRDITLRVDPGRQGLGSLSHTWGDSLVFHKNRDGNPDVLLTFHDRAPWEIWLGKRRGGFTFDRSLRRTDRHNCTTADFAGPAGRPPDGRADLYCVRGANRGTLSDKTNELLIQQPGGGFRNVAGSWGVADPSGRGRAASILDVRGDGRPSLFVGNAEPELHPSMDHIFVNRGRRFVERSTGGLPSVQNTNCSGTGDFDRDGRQDFLSCSYSLRLYRNATPDGGGVSYREMAEDQGLPEGRWRDAGLVRLNGDRWPDLVGVFRNRLEVRLNRQESPHFPEVDFSFPLTAGVAFCSGHADGDTDADLLVVQNLESPSDLRQQRDWMLLSSGTGAAFTSLPVPQPPARRRRNGNGDACSAIPDYRGGRAAWTISNGRMSTDVQQRHRGYRQLVILSR